MKSLNEHINSVMEGWRKDDRYRVKKTSDKYYPALHSGFNGYYYITADELISKNWWTPNDDLTRDERFRFNSLKYKLNEKVGRPGKNPRTGKRIGMYVDDMKSDIAICIRGLGNNEDPSESLAAIIDAFLDLAVEEIYSVRADYKTILKDVRKELIKKYDEMPEGLSREEARQLRKDLDVDPLRILYK